MSEKGQNKSVRNYYVDMLALLPFLALLVSGLVMLKYHSGAGCFL